MHTLSRLARRITGAVLIVVLLAVPPVLLLRMLGSPLLLLVRSVPEDWLRPDTTDIRSLLVAALASVCWIAWLRVALALIIEMCCAACRVRCPRVRLLGGAQSLAALLLGGLSVVAVQHAPSAAAASGSLAVAVRPAGVEFAWADSAFIAAGAAAAVTITRRDRRRRSVPADRAAVPESPVELVRAPVSADLPVAAPVTGQERHDLAAVRALLNRSAADGTAADITGPHSDRPPVLPVRGAAPTFETVEMLETAHTVAPGAAAKPVASPTMPASERNEAPTGAPVPSTEPALPALPDWSFMVRVLGPVDVLDRSGTPVAFERTKAVEFLAWMVLHRRSATRDAVRTALWENDVRDASFSNVVSEARRTLDRHTPPPGQSAWIARPRGELIPLHPAVVADVEVVRAHVARAETLRRHGAEPGRIAAELRSALELVRGAPFIGSGFGWADAESTTSGCTLLVVNAALELGELELATGRSDAALSAASIGLTVLPGHEELVALRLRAHGCAGNIAAVRHEWTSYLRSLTNDPWQSEPSPWLEDLVRGLVAEPAVAG